MEVTKDLEGSPRLTPNTIRILHLTLHRVWFDAIALGVKREEFREVKPYWARRLFEAITPNRIEAIRYDEIHFRNGYAKSAPWMRVEWKGVKLGIFRGEHVYAIQLGKVLKIRNWSPGVSPANPTPTLPRKDPK